MRALRERRVWLMFANERGVVVAALWVAVVRFVSRVPHWFDLTISDDSDYMYFGVHFFDAARAGRPSGDWSPLYKFWFYVLGRLFPDTAVLHYASMILMGALIPLIAYALLRRLGCAPWFAALTAAWLLIHYLTWFPEPRVGLFAVLVLLMVWWGCTLFPDRLQRWWFFAAGSLLVAYVRPEFFLTGIIATVIAGGHTLHVWYMGKKPLKRPGFALLGAGVLAVALLGWWGVPVSGARSVYAFGQHYARNQACLHLDWAVGLHWEEVLQQEFGGADSLLRAVRANPGAVIRHVRCNVQTFAQQLPLLLVRSAFGGERLLLRLFVGGMVWLALARWRWFWARVRASWQDGMLLIGVLSLLPFLLDTLLIYPREHYLTALILPFWVLLAAVFGPQEGGHSLRGRGLWVGALLVVALFPRLDHFFCRKSSRQTGLGDGTIRSLAGSENG